MKLIERGLIAGAVVIATSSAAWGQTSVSGAGPYYASPSWDQQLTAGRFIVLTNWNSEAVLDRETGLVWERTIALGDPQSTASVACIERYTGGRVGWRLPTLQEAASLLVATGSGQRDLPGGHPFQVTLVLGGFNGAPTTLPIPSDFRFSLWSSTLASPDTYGNQRNWFLYRGYTPIVGGVAGFVPAVASAPKTSTGFEPYILCVRSPAPGAAVQ